jgi:hypothetical protein
MKRVLAAAMFTCLTASPALAFNCPVVIKQAEDAIKKAESGKSTAETKPLIEEAKKYVAEARTHHETAKAKKDHADAIRKAKIGLAYAEEAITLAQ